MMQPQMKNLPDFVREKVQLAIFSPHIKSDDTRKWAGYIEISGEHMLRELKTEVLTLENEKKIELFIQSQQYSFIELLNMVTHYGQRAAENGFPEKDLILDFYERISEVLQAVLHFLEKYFPSYFNYNLEVPSSSMILARNEIGSRVTTLKGKLLTMDTARLLKIVTAPLLVFVEDETVKITYRQFRYFRELLDDLEAIKPSDDVNCGVRTAIANLNFNSNEFADYMCDIMNEDLNALDTLAEKLDKLAWFDKNLKQLKIKANRALYEGEPDIVQYLMAYVHQEITYLQSTQVKEINHQPQGATEDQKDFKVETNLTISLQAALLKTFVNAGIIKNTGLTELMRFVTQYFRTSKKDDINFNTFHTLFYSVDASTKTALLAVCKKLTDAARNLD
jgi:hypothetical protein